MTEPSEMHEAMCPALTGGRCTCERNDPAVDKAWARFCGRIGDGPDAPYPGMISAFERYYSQSFTDKDWRNEASVWAAAWKQALLTAAAPTTQPSTTPQADSQPTPVQDYPPLPESIKYGQLDHSSGAYGYRPQDMRAYVDADRAARASAESVPAPVPPPECETEAEKRAFAFGWFKALESERMKADSVQEDAARYRWLREGNDAKHSAAWHVAVNLYGCEWDAAIDAARAAQEGK